LKTLRPSARREATWSATTGLGFSLRMDSDGQQRLLISAGASTSNSLALCSREFTTFVRRMQLPRTLLPVLIANDDVDVAVVVTVLVVLLAAMMWCAPSSTTRNSTSCDLHHQPLHRPCSVAGIRRRQFIPATALLVHVYGAATAGNLPERIEHRKGS